MTKRTLIHRRRSLLARRGPGPTGPRAAGQAPSGGIETAVAAFGRRWAKIGGRARRSSWLPRILGECFLHVADRIGAEAVRPLGAFQTIKDDEYDGADKGNQADQKPPSRPVGVVQTPHGKGQGGDRKG